MKNLLKPALAAGIAVASLAAPVMIAPAAAQNVAQGIAVVNIPAVVANSNAFRTAQEQRPVTFKTQIDQANSRREAIAAQLEPLYTQYQTAQQSQDQQALQQAATQIQQIEAAGQRELQQLLSPVQLSQAYVEEQINDQLATAIQNAAQKRGVTMVISPDSVLYADNAYNMNQAVLDELNTLIPSAQLVPPEGWLPRELREQQQAAAAEAQAQQPAVAPVQGR